MNWFKKRKWRKQSELASDKVILEIAKSKDYAMFAILQPNPYIAKRILNAREKWEREQWNKKEIE